MHHYQPDDHQRIAKIIQHLKAPWLVSYDNGPQIKRLYRGHDQIEYGLQYNAARAYVGTEVLFFSPKLRLPLGSAIPSVDSALRRHQAGYAKRK